ncbi:hypothetical protein [Methylobacterium platani]|uniref:hypothetical protein n=1 Tax=Methylobacterium platani TaxID=427683 RepID=UPI000AA92F6D|nr:hypothetical protein [Methylobacterium platani]
MKDVAPGVYLVFVRETNDSDNPTPAHLWVAAVPQAEAVEAVRALVPEGGHVEMSRDYPTRKLVADLNLRPGDVREIVEAE